MTNYIRSTDVRAATVLVIMLICLGVTARAVTANGSEQSQAKEVLDTALAVWHFATAADSAGTNSAVEVRGAARLAQPLSKEQRDASLARGGDAMAAELDGGWLDAGQGAKNELRLSGDQFTALIRIRCRATSLWSTRGFFTKGGGHDQLVFNFFSYDFQRGPQGMRVGCEIGVEGKAGLGGQVTALVQQIGPEQWHDLIARYDGRELILFVDGVAMDKKPASGKLRQGNREPLTIGSGGGGDNPFPGWIDHAAIWDRALSNAEIVALSGGSDAVEQQRIAFANYVAPPQEPLTSELIAQSRQLVQKFQHDPHRPRYHFLTPEEGDIMPGDPNGAIWWKGRYHLFYIFQRHQSVEPQTVHCWGHSSSIDLVHWEHHPTALDVAPDDPDRGIFSGNALINKDGVPVLLYHGVNVGNCIALAQDDRLIRWKKSEHNPIVPIPKQGEDGYGKYDSWDPHGWLEGDQFFAIFGGNPGTGAPATLFRGPQLTELKYVGPFLTNDSWSEPGEDVSCPDFFAIGDRHMLLCISHMRGARYFLGKWENEHFVAETHGRMNWPGGSFFAPESLLDHQGRRIVWAWCLDERPQADRVAGGWSGVMSLPRVLSLDDQGQLRIEPPEELFELCIGHQQQHGLQLTSDGEVALDAIQGDSLRLSVQLQPRDARQYGVKVRRTPDGTEETSIYYDEESHQLCIDVSKSTLNPAIRYRTWSLFQPPALEDRARRVTLQSAPLVLEENEPLHLEVFIDRSMLEVFANKRQCITQRIWPTRDDAVGVSVFSRGGAAEASVDAWEMAASNPH